MHGLMDLRSMDEQLELNVYESSLSHSSLFMHDCFLNKLDKLNDQFRSEHLLRCFISSLIIRRYATVNKINVASCRDVIWMLLLHQWMDWKHLAMKEGCF